MSDALTEAARDGAEAERFNEYLRATLKYIETEAELFDEKESLIILIQKCIQVHGHEHNEPHTPNHAAREILEISKQLKENNEETWKSFLISVSDSYHYSQFLNLSPFKKGFVILEQRNPNWGPKILKGMEYLIPSEVLAEISPRGVTCFVPVVTAQTED